MSLTVVTARPCNAVELGKVMEFCERLGDAGPDTDIRVPLDSGCIHIDSVHGDVAVSVLGELYGEPFAATIVSNSVGTAVARFTDLLSTTLKVDMEKF